MMYFDFQKIKSNTGLDFEGIDYKKRLRARARRLILYY